MAKRSRRSLNLDYYGIISVLADEIGITETIDQMVDNHYNLTVSTGQSVKAILLNMMAIFMRPLYLTSEFLNDKPVEKLIDPDLTADQFTDDVLGPALDRLYETGLEEIFLNISSKVMRDYPDFISPHLHADTTTMTVHGEYETKSHETAIEIRKGRPQPNKRNDLKQFIISMVTCDRLPVFLSTASGNDNDSKTFREIITEYSDQMQEAFDLDRTWVFDTLFFGKPNIEVCGTNVKWVTRVSERLKKCKELVQTLDEDKFQEIDLEGYKIFGLDHNYGGIKQRWVVVESDKAYYRERKRLEKKLSKRTEDVEKDVWHLGNDEFESKECAIKTAKEVVNDWKYHTISGDLDDPESLEFEVVPKKADGTPGRPSEDEEMINYYKIKLDPIRSEDRIREAFASKGRFVLATNNLELSDVEVLQTYKNQSKVERGFRFLKDPMFLVDRIFLENEHRIMAMSMIMGLALLIYSLAEKKLRAAFKAHDEKFQDRYRKQTKTPTIRRVLQTWSGIHVWYIEVGGELIEKTVMNLRPENQQVLRLLGPKYQQIYDDNSTYQNDGDEQKNVG